MGAYAPPMGTGLASATGNSHRATLLMRSVPLSLRGTGGLFLSSGKQISAYSYLYLVHSEVTGFL